MNNANVRLTLAALPSSGSSGFGTVVVRGRMRVPSPPTSTIALIVSRSFPAEPRAPRATAA